MNNLNQKIKCPVFTKIDNDDTNAVLTRLHSSRMRTAGALTVSHSMLGRVSAWGVYAAPIGQSPAGGLLLGGVCSGGVSAAPGGGGCLLGGGGGCVRYLPPPPG